MGIGTILDARRCVLLATGARKADIIARAVEGPMTSMVSATALQWHPQCTVVLDESAGSRLTESVYYQRAFDREPRWESFRQPAATPRNDGSAKKKAELKFPT